ncbi:hypothetical protein FRC09_019422 [Ceratobasidium sp. 395]|nr:hypothetical protein FRC09_019422 [Ceratobasidium sp. 395]
MSSHSKLVDGGATLIETVTRPADGKATDTPLDQVTVHDGFYRIVQYDDDGNELEASFDPSNSDQGIFGYSMTMSPPQPASQTWKFTRQWGFNNNFTIVPKDAPQVDDSSPYSKLGSAVDTPNEWDSMRVVRWSYYNIWPIRCDESRTYRLKDGSTKTVYYFRIFVADNHVKGWTWKTEQGKKGWKLGMGQPSWDPINDKELYQLVPDNNA